MIAAARQHREREIQGSQRQSVLLKLDDEQGAFRLPMLSTNWHDHVETARPSALVSELEAQVGLMQENNDHPCELGEPAGWSIGSTR